ncbi:MAG: hypothetical protein WBY71_02080 [Nitrososphaeraceae archaeon]
MRRIGLNYISACDYDNRFSNSILGRAIDLTDIRALIWSSCNIDILIVTMKKDFIVARIEASQDGSPYVYVAFGDPNDYKPGGERQQQNPFGSNVMAFTSPEDLMKNLPKAMGNISKMMGGSSGLTDTPTFKISMKEYEDIGIKVGDKVTIEVKKSDSAGIYT